MSLCSVCLILSVSVWCVRTFATAPSVYISMKLVSQWENNLFFSCFFLPSINFINTKILPWQQSLQHNFVYIVNVRTHLLRIRPKRWCPMLFVQLTIWLRIRIKPKRNQTKAADLLKISHVRDGAGACVCACIRLEWRFRLKVQVN